MAYIVVFPSVLAFWSGATAWAARARARGPVAHLMPAFGPILAMMVLGERVAPAELVGALVIFAGMALVLREKMS